MFGNNRTKYQYTALGTSTAENTIVTADPNTRNQLVGLIITTTDAAAATITLRDGTAGATAAVLNYPNAASAPGAPLVITFDPPLDPIAKNSNWTAQMSVNAGRTDITALYVKEQ